MLYATPPRELTPSEYPCLPGHGIGLTHVCKRASGNDLDLAHGDFDVTGFWERINEHRPRIVAFNGKQAAKTALRLPVVGGAPREPGRHPGMGAPIHVRRRPGPSERPPVARPRSPRSTTLTVIAYGPVAGQLPGTACALRHPCIALGIGRQGGLAERRNGTRWSSQGDSALTGATNTGPNAVSCPPPNTGSRQGSDWTRQVGSTRCRSAGPPSAERPGAKAVESSASSLDATMTSINIVDSWGTTWLRSLGGRDAKGHCPQGVTFCSSSRPQSSWPSRVPGRRSSIVGALEDDGRRSFG